MALHFSLQIFISFGPSVLTTGVGRDVKAQSDNISRLVKIEG